MLQLAAPKPCQIPFRFGLPSSVRPTAGTRRAAAGAWPWPEMAAVQNTATAAMSAEMTVNPLNPMRMTSLHPYALPRDQPLFIELLKMVWGLVVLAYVFLQACAWPQHVFALDSVQATSDRSTFQQRQQAKSRDNTATLRGLGSQPVNFTASIMKAKASITGRRVYH